MPITFTCSQCGATQQVPETQRGLPHTCSSCGELGRVPGYRPPPTLHFGKRLFSWCLVNVWVCSALLLLAVTALAVNIASRQTWNEMIGGLVIIGFGVFGCTAIAWAFVAIASAPGRIAYRRHHPQAEAIDICGWLGLLFTGGIGWFVALVWAHTVPKRETNKE